MKPTLLLPALLVACSLTACSPDPVDLAGGSGSFSAGTTQGATSTTTGGVTASAGGSSGSSSSTGPGGVSGIGSTGPLQPDLPVVNCNPSDLFEPMPVCTTTRPNVGFEPELVWTWTQGDDGDRPAIAGPVVMNLTDDNGNGTIDICDTPDVVIAAGPNGASGPGRLYIVDGATGETHFKIVEELINPTVTPALGDVDGDGLPEIITVTDGLFNGIGQLVVFNHDGTLHAKGSVAMGGMWHNSPALADLDNDGEIEIIVDGYIYDHEANLLVEIPGTGWGNSIVDLDGDSDLEIIRGRSAYHHDGTEVYNLGAAGFNSTLGYSSVANLDDDPEPEIVYTNAFGVTVLEHDGTVLYQDQAPTGEELQPFYTWRRATSIGDYLGDGTATLAMLSKGNALVLAGDTSVVWANPEVEAAAVSTAGFDFLGVGQDQVVYQFNAELKIMGEAAEILSQITVEQSVFNRNPVIADVDNDGSADILTASEAGVSMISHVDRNWVPARRVWNQYSYHITNIGEDGQVPQFEIPHWTVHNTYRTQAQIEDGEVCRPVPVKAPR